MINITYKVQDEEVETVKWMRDIWKEKWLVKPDSIEVSMDNLVCTEKEYLNKVMEWIYKNGTGTIVVNGTEYDVSELVNG